MQEPGRRSASIVRHVSALLIGFGMGCAVIYASGGQPLAVVFPSDSMAVRSKFMHPVMGASPFLPKAVQQRGPAPVRSTNPDAPIKLGVNGFGRIGRQVVRIAMERDSFVLKHINSPMSPEYMKYLLEHDTVHGRFKGTCEIIDGGLKINGLPVSLSATRDPTEIPWASVGVEYVCESTGAFTTTPDCMKHIEGGAKKVIISAPAKDAETPTLVVGVNTEDYS